MGWVERVGIGRLTSGSTTMAGDAKFDNRELPLILLHLSGFSNG